jgi:hypothetical protein
VAAIIMDLLKAFDYLPHDIPLCKLSAYGLSPKSVELLRNYLTVVSNKSNFRQISAVGLKYKKLYL